jgi:hypothetical protein
VFARAQETRQGLTQGRCSTTSYGGSSSIIIGQGDATKRRTINYNAAVTSNNFSRTNASRKPKIIW